MTYNDTDPDRELKLSDPVARGDEQSGMAMVGIVAAIAVVLIAGLVYFNLGGSETATTSNTPPGVTTGSSPPSAPTPAEKTSPQR